MEHISTTNLEFLPHDANSLLDDKSKHQLDIISTKIRMEIIDSTFHAKSGHPGGSLSIADIIAYLYFYRMNASADNANDPDRDRFVLSKGHCAPALYAALALKGYFPVEEMKFLRKTGHMLQGHPDKKHIPGIDMSSGSLGQGISAACGMAIAAKMQNKDYKVYCVLGDGEIQEGQVWESAMFAAHYKLNNLMAFIDFNDLQITGRTTEIMSLGDIRAKFEAFGWNAISIDGHDFYELDNAWHSFINSDRPTAVICNTLKGKGVSFMEDVCYWHGNPPNAEQHALAMNELVEKMNSLVEEI
jgi:transketolase